MICIKLVANWFSMIKSGYYEIPSRLSISWRNTEARPPFLCEEKGPEDEATTDAKNLIHKKTTRVVTSKIMLTNRMVG